MCHEEYLSVTIILRRADYHNEGVTRRMTYGPTQHHDAAGGRSRIAEDSLVSA